MAINYLQTGMHINLFQTQELNLFDTAITKANVTMSSKCHPSRPGFEKKITR